MTDETTYITVKIASGQTKSAAVPVNFLTILKLEVAEAITGTGITLEGAMDGETFRPMYEQDGTALGITLGDPKAGIYAFNSIASTVGIRAVKLVSSASEGADRTFKLVTGKIL
jgi:hypothetical protein